MGLYLRLQFLPNNFLITFEEAFYMGFFEHGQMSWMFSPITVEYAANYVAFLAVEDQNPYILQLMSMKQLRWKDQRDVGLQNIWEDYEGGKVGPSLPHP